MMLRRAGGYLTRLRGAAAVTRAGPAQRHLPLDNRRIGPHTSDAEILALFQRIGAGWSASGRAWPSYTASFDTVDKIRAARVFVQGAVASKVRNFEQSVGCDLGCWLGFPCAIHLAVGAAEVYGVDILPEFIALAQNWVRAESIDRLTFACIETCAVPLPSASVDWVLINQVLCNAKSDSIPALLAEAHRILRHGGVLVLADSNNPHCAETKARLLETYCALEIGDGDSSRPRGVNHLHRAAVIRSCAGLDEAESEELARRTCYLWGDSLVDAANRVRDGGTAPRSFFRAHSLAHTPVNPENGLALGNVTDPFEIAAMMDARGFRSEITVSPGGGNHAPKEVLDMLRSSQGFYVYGRKA